MLMCIRVKLLKTGQSWQSQIPTNTTAKVIIFSKQPIWDDKYDVHRQTPSIFIQVCSMGHCVKSNSWGYLYIVTMCTMYLYISPILYHLWSYEMHIVTYL